jgi:plastocyanin
VRRAVAGIALAAALLGGGTAAVTSSLAAGVKRVAVKDDFFSPRSLTVSKGAKVRWVWKGKGRHNVAVGQGPVIFRARTRRSGHFDHTFKKRGTYRIVCTIHAPDMQMTVRVK